MDEIKFIIDENISWRLKRLLPQWDIVPVNEIDPAHRKTDLEIWRFARQNNFVVITFDEDFVEWEM